MLIVMRLAKDVGKWMQHKFLILFTHGRADNQVREAIITYNELSLPGYELTDKHIQGSRTVRKMPRFNVESGTRVTYGEGHHGS